MLEREKPSYYYEKKDEKRVENILVKTEPHGLYEIREKLYLSKLTTSTIYNFGKSSRVFKPLKIEIDLDYGKKRKLVGGRKILLAFPRYEFFSEAFQKYYNEVLLEHLIFSFVNKNILSRKDQNKILFYNEMGIKEILKYKPLAKFYLILVYKYGTTIGANYLFSKIFLRVLKLDSANFKTIENCLKKIFGKLPHLAFLFLILFCSKNKNNSLDHVYTFIENAGFFSNLKDLVLVLCKSTDKSILKNQLKYEIKLVEEKTTPNLYIFDDLADKEFNHFVSSYSGIFEDQNFFQNNYLLPIIKNDQ